jgi:hypothetical protein
VVFQEVAPLEHLTQPLPQSTTTSFHPPAARHRIHPSLQHLNQPQYLSAMAASTRHISSPTELSQLHQSAETAASTANPPQTLIIHLLTPLWDADTLEQCLHNCHVVVMTGDKFLKLSSLVDRWRAAWVQLPADAAEKIVFDVTLPDEIYFSSRVAAKRSMMVMDVDAIRLVTLLATTMSLRSRKSVVFEMTGDGTPTWDVFDGLRRTLEGLSKPQDDGEA